jgi:hypothetical protein
MSQNQKVKRVKLEAFAIHGHVGSTPASYADIFDLIAEIPRKQRREIHGDRIMAIQVFQKVNGLYHFAVHVGSADESFLVLDLNVDEEEERSLENGKIVVQKTLGLIDPIKRLAIVQLNHRGAKAGQIAQMIARLASLANPSQFRNLTLEFAPQPSVGFLAALEAFDVIRLASVRFAKPNLDFTPFSDKIRQLAADSDAKSIQVAATADRGHSLAKDHGIVAMLKEFVQEKFSSLKAVTVEGRSESESAFTTLSLHKNTESKYVDAQLSPSGQPFEQDVFAVAQKFVEELPGSQEFPTSFDEQIKSS